MVPIAQSSTRIRSFSAARNPSSRAALSSRMVSLRTMCLYSSRSEVLPCRRWLADRLERFYHVCGQVWGARGRHYVGAVDERLGPGQDVLGHLDAVLRGVFGREVGEPLADGLRDVHAGGLVVEELGLSGAAQGHQAEEEAGVEVAHAL